MLVMAKKKEEEIEDKVVETHAYVDESMDAYVAESLEMPDLMEDAFV